jgi:hypothetical protein
MNQRETVVQPVSEHVRCPLFYITKTGTLGYIPIDDPREIEHQVETRCQSKQ